MTARATASPVFHAHDANGAPLVGGKLTTYAAGTTTLKATYADASGLTPHPNPVVLNARGEANIHWGNGLYKLRLTDAADVLVYELDGFDPQVADTPQPAVSLIANGSFENDSDSDGQPDGWELTPYSGGQVTTERYNASSNPAPQVHQGEAALRFVHPGGVGNGGGFATTAAFSPVTPGVDLEVTFALKTTVPTLRCVVDMLWYDSAKQLVSTTSVYDNQTSNPTVWGLFQQRAVVLPASAARFFKLRLTGGHDSVAVAGSAYFDALQVQPVWRVATATASGFMAASDKVMLLANSSKLAGIDAGATVDQTQADINALNVNADTVDGLHATTSASANTLLALDGAAKLPASITGDAATVGGLTPAALADRANHTGTQPPTSISPQGAASGLDADTVDGLEASAFALQPAAAATNFRTIGTFYAREDTTTTGRFPVLGTVPQAGGTVGDALVGGVNYVWADLNLIPANATAIDVVIEMETSTGVGNSPNIQGGVLFFNNATPVGGMEYSAGSYQDPAHQTTSKVYARHTAILGANRSFGVSWSETTPGTINLINLILVGYWQ